MTNETHRTINTAAKVLGIVLMAVFICTIVKGIFSVVGSPVDKSESGAGAAVAASEIKATEGSALTIKIGATDLNITSGDKFTYETNDKSIRVTERFGSVEITDIKDNDRPSKKGYTYLNITIPRDASFSTFNLDCSYGDIDIDTVAAKVIDFDFGAGDVKIKSLIAETSADIDAGAGNVKIEGGKINNLDFEVGMGDADIAATLTGVSDLECGVGDLSLDIIGNRDDYSLTVEKGIGEIKIDGAVTANNSVVGSGANTVKVEGGVGETDIKFV